MQWDRVHEREMKCRELHLKKLFYYKASLQLDDEVVPVKGKLPAAWAENSTPEAVQV